MANEARLNLVITARDEAKAAIEGFANSIKSTFEGMQNTISKPFDSNGFTNAFDKIENTAFMTRAQLEETFNGIKGSFENTSLAALENSQLTSAQMRNIVEAANEMKIQVVKDFQDINNEPVNQAFQKIAETAFMTRSQLEESFNGVKMSFENESLAAQEAAQLTTSQLRNIVEAANGMKIQVVQDMDETGNAMQHMSESLDFMNLQMAGDMIKQVGEQITGFFEHAVSSAADFDQSIVNTTASLDANMGSVKLNTQQIKAMQDAAISMGESGFFSANQVADAMNTMSKQGISYQQIMSGGIQTVYKVAAANQADLESTANVVSDIYNEMGDMFKASGMSAQQASQLIGNSMTVALHHARISMEDFMTTMKYVGPQAAAMGVGIKDVSAMIALLGEHGRNAA